MIYTVTLNPAIDRELTVPSIDFCTVLRATGKRVDVGGKGVNVSRMVHQLGGESVTDCRVVLYGRAPSGFAGSTHIHVSASVHRDGVAIVRLVTSKEALPGKRTVIGKLCCKRIINRRL